MKVIIQATGMEGQPKLIESGNGYATVYGCQVLEFDSFEAALVDYKHVLNHSARLSALIEDDED